MTDLFEDDDLFAVRPKPARRPAKVKPDGQSCESVKQSDVCQPERGPVVSTPDHVPGTGDMVRQPSGRVASFSCVCGGQDEVREPAPATVQCWSCKPARTMKRWNPGYDTPYVSARDLTDEERSRIAAPG